MDGRVSVAAQFEDRTEWLLASDFNFDCVPQRKLKRNLGAHHLSAQLFPPEFLFAELLGSFAGALLESNGLLLLLREAAMIEDDVRGGESSRSVARKSSAKSGAALRPAVACLRSLAAATPGAGRRVCACAGTAADTTSMVVRKRSVGTALVRSHLLVSAHTVLEHGAHLLGPAEFCRNIA